MSTRKVYSAWQRKHAVPQIKLQGRWLDAAGLTIGAAIRVQVEHGRLVITPATATP
ncbi:SymE family type I addiction module toxin [Prosthecobacter sp.]|uniref:SymE family type I addiction module toxin n=1 Tax=Prosthecobacter sp. TaxID=1965333 RepID=UPI003782E8A0